MSQFLKLSRPVLVLAPFALIGSCTRQAEPNALVPDPAQAAARSLSIVASATPEHPKVLKVLFYGQSISTPKWTDIALRRLRKQYPGVAFDAKNLALGGWSAAQLERAAARDVAEFYPDLIVFHVYGDHRAYERIIRTFRSQTAADVIVQTDHVVEPVEPVCAEGLHLSLSAHPGCKGCLWFKQNSWEEYMSSTWVPSLARKYNLALEPRRRQWDRYLTAYNVPRTALLADKVHPNARGWNLMANLFVDWFERQVGRTSRLSPQVTPQVTVMTPPAPGTTRSYSFEGNRIEVLAAGPLAGRVQATIDGKTSENVDGCWINGRVSRLPNVPDWPALKQVDVAATLHRPAQWTIEVTGLNAKQDSFRFKLLDQNGNLDGEGNAATDFRSTSGQVAIKAEDWNLGYALETSGKPVPERSRFSWTRSFLCQDQPAVVRADGSVEQRHVIATGLPNGSHVLKLTVAREAPQVYELRSYQPPLKD